MLFSINLTTCIHLGLAVSSVLGQRLNKPAAWPNLDQFGPELNKLPRTGTRISPWVSGNISKGCRDRVLLDKRDPTKFKAYTIFMDDCDQPWVICQEEGAEGTINELVNTLARVPVGMREYIGDITHVKGGGASAWGNIIQFGGTTVRSVGVALHEASHNIDSAKVLGFRSGDQTWRNAVNEASHVADNYAQTNHVENFAQYAGLIIYDRVTNRGLQALQPQYNQIAPQLRRMGPAADAARKLFELSGSKRCVSRYPATPAVNPGTGAIVNKREESKSYAPRDVGILMMPLPDLESIPVTDCSFESTI